MIATIPGPLSAFAEWLLETSFQTSVLICAVLVIQLAARRSLSAQWRHALWLLVLLRLILPWTPESRTSVYNLVPNPVSRALAVATSPTTTVATTPGVASRKGRADVILAIWLIGAAGFGSWLLVEAVSTFLAFRGRRPVTDRAVLDLLEDCKDTLGVRTYLAIVESTDIRAPALFGWVRPRLLLPEGLIGRLSQEGLRHVFLHELAHLKRHDIALNWLMALAQTMHWFNPLVWLALARARVDMELACDELVLEQLAEDERRGYGRTILDLLDTLSRPRRVPMLAAIGEDAGQIKRRIQMVADFTRERRLSRLLPVAILVALVVVFLADARDTNSTSSAVQSSPTNVQQRSADAEEPPLDAAIRSAGAWMALLDAGKCGETWDESHSRVRGLMSRGAWIGLCNELLLASREACGKLLSRKVIQVEYVPDLPMGLGVGVSVRFQSNCGKGRFLGPKLLMAKDNDGVWRRVRSDQE